MIIQTKFGNCKVEQHTLCTNISKYSVEIYLDI